MRWTGSGRIVSGPGRTTAARRATVSETRAVTPVLAPPRAAGLAATLAAIAATTLATPAVAADASIDVSKAWTPATTQIRADVPFYLTITSHADTADSLIRVRCPTDLADGTAKHVVDVGEGGTAMREVKSLPVPAGTTLTLAPGGNHLMLLHLRVPLQEAQTFTCSMAFQQAGTIAVEVKVAPSGATEAP